MKKFIGKPYAGKPHVRFDEGAGKVLLSFPLYSTASVVKKTRKVLCTSYILPF
jgi:hypothetical protein